MSVAAIEDRVFQALADPSRRAIFESLTRGEKALKEAGLVRRRREGRCVYYRVRARGLKPLVDWIAHYRAFWTEHMGRLGKLLERMDG